MRAPPAAVLVVLAVLPATAVAQVRPGAPARARAEVPARAHAAARPAAEAAAFRGVVLRELARHPRMDPQDVYKLAFQGAMGSRHAGLDSAMAAEWLDREIAALGDGPPEPVRDTISPDGRMVRVNLRPYLAAGGSREALLEAFVRTAREYAGSVPLLRWELAEVERMAAAGEVPLAAAALHAYFDTMRAQGYPAVEHSAAYEAAYRPAYRVVLGDLLPPAAGAAKDRP